MRTVSIKHSAELHCAGFCYSLETEAASRNILQGTGKAPTCSRSACGSPVSDQGYDWDQHADPTANNKWPSSSSCTKALRAQLHTSVELGISLSEAEWQLQSSCRPVNPFEFAMPGCPMTEASLSFWHKISLAAQQLWTSAMCTSGQIATDTKATLQFSSDSASASCAALLNLPPSDLQD